MSTMMVTTRLDLTGVLGDLWLDDLQDDVLDDAATQLGRFLDVTRCVTSFDDSAEPVVGWMEVTTDAEATVAIAEVIQRQREAIAAEARLAGTLDRLVGVQNALNQAEREATLLYGEGEEGARARYLALLQAQVNALELLTLEARQA